MAEAGPSVWPKTFCTEPKMRDVMADQAVKALNLNLPVIQIAAVPDAPQRAATVAEQSPQGINEFLVAFWHSIEFQIIVVVLVVGLLGILCNYIVKWSQGQIEGNLWTYLFVNNFRRTLAGYITFVTSMIAIIGAGTFINDQGVFAGWKAVIFMAFSTAFAFDAAINKGQRPVWTASQRKVAKQAKGGTPPDGAVLPKSDLKPASKRSTKK